MPAAPAPASASGPAPQQMVDALYSAFGDNHSRAVHAKGVMAVGTFEPSQEGAAQTQTRLGDPTAAEVDRSASRCAFYEDVDIDFMIALLGGPEMTVWDTEPPCEICGRRTHFLASPGSGSVFRPLLNVPPDHIAPLPIQAWMAGWFVALITKIPKYRTIVMFRETVRCRCTPSTSLASTRPQ